jgi:hypothetical protein
MSQAMSMVLSKRKYFSHLHLTQQKTGNQPTRHAGCNTENKAAAALNVLAGFTPLQYTP